MPTVPYREGTRNGQSRERGGVPRHPGLRGSEGAREKTRTLASLARGPTRGGRAVSKAAPAAGCRHTAPDAIAEAVLPLSGVAGDGTARGSGGGGAGSTSLLAEA